MGRRKREEWRESDARRGRTIAIQPGVRNIDAGTLVGHAATLQAVAATGIVCHVTNTNCSTQPSRRDDVMVVIPCFNEAKRLNPPAFGDFLDRSAGVTLVFVDDGSTDDTPMIVERMRQQHPRQVCTLRLSSNVGKAEAVRRGMQVVRRRRPAFIGYWDADLATPLNAIDGFCEVMRERPELALVMGSRVALLGRQIRRSGLRHIIGRTFATAASLILGLPVYDTQCGAKLFRVTATTSALFSQPFRSRWVFDVEILARMVTAATNADGAAARDCIYEYPLEKWQDVRGSRLQPLDFLIAGIDLAAIYWKHRRAMLMAAAAISSKIENLTSGIPHRNAA